MNVASDVLAEVQGDPAIRERLLASGWRPEWVWPGAEHALSLVEAAGWPAFPLASLLVSRLGGIHFLPRSPGLEFKPKGLLIDPLAALREGPDPYPDEFAELDPSGRTTRWFPLGPREDGYFVVSDGGLIIMEGSGGLVCLPTVRDYFIAMLFGTRRNWRWAWGDQFGKPWT